MRLFGRTILVLGAIAAAAVFGAPLVAGQELKSEGSAPGISVVIQSLKRDASNSVTLRFQLINDSDKPAPPMNLGNEGYKVNAVYLIDNVNKKKYLVVRDTDKNCICADYHGMGAGARVNLWAKFAAPAENVDKITVVVPDFQPIDDVPITR